LQAWKPEWLWQMTNLKKRILVVEDNIVMADDLSNTLMKLGYEVLEPAITYSEAIKALEKEVLDLVILDINLGTKKTGVDVANYIKKNLNLPFIFLTSFTDIRTLELAKATVPYAYLVKPYQEIDIMVALEIALSNFQKLASNNTIDAERQIPDFTSMETVVLKKIAENLTTKQMATELFISESTVKNHRHNICQKLALPSSNNSLLTWVLNNKQHL